MTGGRFSLEWPLILQFNPWNVMESNPAHAETQHVTAASARMSARLFSLGNIIAMLPGLVVAPIILLGQPERTSMILMFILMIECYMFLGKDQS